MVALGVMEEEVWDLVVLFFQDKKKGKIDLVLTWLSFMKKIRVRSFFLEIIHLMGFLNIRAKNIKNIKKKLF